MYTSISGDELNIFQKPARVIIAGSSGAGKSYFVSALISKYRQVFTKVIVIGSDLENCNNLNITRDDSYDPLNDDENGNSPKLIIFDDIIYNKSHMKLAAECFIRGRHKNISLLFLTQNIFLSDKDYRIIALNATHVGLFRSRDLRQIQYFGKTFLCDNQISEFIKLYKKKIVNIQYGYLFIDFTKSCDSPLMIRSNVTGNEYEHAFLL